jgi:wyosine [tRNA(Phe)-imidazoG37] synthetase (radical SAM superfamily)
MITFGPVPSRRFNQSLGINNLPKKICTYSCVYCQIGKTKHKQISPQYFYQPEDIFSELQDNLVKIYKWGKHLDYVTFVPNGEPTLDINLGKEIELLKFFNVKIAVITNSSLLSYKDVRNDLMKADSVSLKIDTLNEEDWHIINRPANQLEFNSILKGIIDFSKTYKGKLITETMLIEGVNTDRDKQKNIAQFLGKINPYVSYISVPIRPPAEKWVKIPNEKTINQCYQVFKEYVDNVEYLIGYEGNAFSYTGNIEENILDIMSVHPMKKEAIEHMLNQANQNWETVQNLIFKDKLSEVEYEGFKYYLRKPISRS